MNVGQNNVTAPIESVVCRKTGHKNAIIYHDCIDLSRFILNPVVIVNIFPCPQLITKLTIPLLLSLNIHVYV